MLPVTDGEHSFVLKIGNPSFEMAIRIFYIMSSGTMSSTSVSTASQENGSFSSFSHVPYERSGIFRVNWGDAMQNLAHPFFGIDLDSAFSVISFTFDGLVVPTFSMSNKINVFDGRSTNSVMEITPIDLSDLGGNFSKYVQGDRVFYGTYGIWEVLKSTLMLVSEDTFMPMYQLRQNIADDGQPVKYRYNVAPQNVLTLYVPPKSLTVGG